MSNPVQYEYFILRIEKDVSAQGAIDTMDSLNRMAKLGWELMGPPIEFGYSLLHYLRREAREPKPQDHFL